MDNPVPYIHVNHLQRFGARQALQEFGSVINWRSDGLDSVLDVGCGPGDVTIDILMSFLPADFSRLVGVDISKAMINYARETYAQPNLSFEQFDLSKDLEKQPFRNAEPFDHIFSFYVLMWTSHLETCIQNFHKLLVPSGDMLLLYNNYPVFDVYKVQSLEKRWAKYMSDVDQRRPPFQGSRQLRKDICALLSYHGFCDFDVKVRKRNIQHKNIASLRGTINFNSLKLISKIQFRLIVIRIFPLCVFALVFFNL